LGDLMKKLRKFAAVLALTAMAAGAAEAASPRCFLPAEIEAEQAMLFQTELMVVAEACRHPAYIAFLRRNLEPVKQYQAKMIEHFRRHGEKKADIALDAYLTKLANESSLRNGQVPVTTVCQQGAQLLKTADALGPRDFRTYAAEKATINRQHYLACK
jgi:hypothetical protein